MRFGGIEIKRVAARASRHTKPQAKIAVVRETGDTRLAKYLSLTPSD